MEFGKMEFKILFVKEYEPALTSLDLFILLFLLFYYYRDVTFFQNFSGRYKKVNQTFGSE